MKKLTRKLFLSVCTLAICAETLVSTTFAWYTSNTEVDVTGITGSAGTDGSASIYVSLDKTTWSQSVDLSALFTQTGTGTEITPLELKEGALYELNGNTAITDVKKYVEFTLYFKTASTANNVPLYIQDITLKNVKTNINQLTPFDNLLYNPNGQSEDVAGGIKVLQPTYAVDIVNALAMHTLSSTEAVKIVDGETVKTTVAAIERNIDLANVVTSLGTTESVSQAAAMDYYNAVMSSNTGYQAPENNSTELDPISETQNSRTQVALLPADGSYISVTFRIFLNGWDEYCYDACKGQSFTVSFTFTSVK